MDTAEVHRECHVKTCLLDNLSDTGVIGSVWIAERIHRPAQSLFKNLLRAVHFTVEVSPREAGEVRMGMAVAADRVAGLLYRPQLVAPPHCQVAGLLTEIG